MYCFRLNAVSKMEGAPVEVPGCQRRRRVAVVHHHDVMRLDDNGNTWRAPRLAKLTETSTEEAPKSFERQTSNDDRGQISFTEDNVFDNTESNFDQNIVNLIETLTNGVKLSNNLANFIKKELISSKDVNANIEFKTRRNSSVTSCYRPFMDNKYNDNQSKSRRQSVSDKKSSSLPRHKSSLATEYRGNHLYDNSNRTGSKRRRSSVYGTSSRRYSSVANDAVLERFSDQPRNTSQSSTRRNSVAHTWTRRVSLAYAYQNDTDIRARKMSLSGVSSTVNGDGAVNVSGVQRRRSSVKPPCFPVMKVVCAHKRLLRLNRRRKRQERAEVSIADVKTAFKEIRTNGNPAAATSNSEHESNGEYESNGDDHIEQDDTCVVPDEEIVEASETLTDTQVDPSAVTDGSSRRKTSIQVRAWELSRKIRQRRREKRKGFTESNVI